jgi:hypothetical protein
MNGKMVKRCLACDYEEYTTFEIENKGVCIRCGYSGGRIVLSNAKRVRLPNNIGVFIPLE